MKLEDATLADLVNEMNRRGIAALVAVMDEGDPTPIRCAVHGSAPAVSLLLWHAQEEASDHLRSHFEKVEDPA